jgi:hypothetical protein
MKTLALKVIKHLSEDNCEVQKVLGSLKLGLIQILVESTSSIDDDITSISLDILSNIVKIFENVIILATLNPDFPLKLVTVAMSSKGPIKVNALKCIGVLSYFPQNNILSKVIDSGFIQFIIQELKSNKMDNSLQTETLLEIISRFSLEKGVMVTLIESEVISSIIYILRNTNPCTKLFNNALLALLPIIRSPVAAKICRDLEGVTLIRDLIDDKSLIGLVAMFSIVFLLGQDEGSKTQKSLLQEKPEFIDIIITILGRSLNGAASQEYVFSQFPLCITSRLLLTLSISDANKEYIVLKPLLPLLLKIVKLYSNNTPQISCISNSHLVAGGGGNDIETIETVIETILHLSLYFEDDIELQTKLMTPDLQITTILSDMLSNDEQFNRLSFPIRSSVISILRRLNNNSRPAGGAVKAARSLSHLKRDLSDTDVHITISYHSECKTDLVMLLINKLRESKFDVWTKDTGSSLIGPEIIQAAELERKQAIYEAMDISRVIIICLSSQYKISAYCKEEGIYASSLHKARSNNLTVIYLIMDFDMIVDGRLSTDNSWMGKLVDSINAKWYALWDMDKVVSLADTIVNLLENIKEDVKNS